VGFAFGGQYIPIVPGAILFDLGIGKPGIHPNVAMGEAAAAEATAEAVKEGCVGAGTGATIGKLFGMTRAMKSGIGSWTVTLPGGVLVSALVALNAVGDVRDPATGKLIAGARKNAASRDLADSEAEMKRGATIGGVRRGNTTLGVVATNARLNKVQANKLAQFASLGVARTIYPVNTMSDGDVVFALSAGELAADINTLGVAAAEAVGQSVLRAAQLAKSLGGVPGLAG
jgi:L-aminopeptidase/D-esterase-like protein